MNLNITAIFYGLLGASVAVAVLLSDTSASRRERWFRGATAVLFWPLYLPLLLRPNNNSAAARFADDIHGAQPSDELTALIAQVERELEAALRSLEAEPLQTRLPKPSQLDELQSAWHQQAERIRELDTLLAQPTLAAAPAAAGGSTAERVSQSGQSRQQNLRQLQALRQQMHDDLLATLDSVRELITRIHLTKFTGASATRTAELIAQIATTVVAKTSSNI